MRTSILPASLVLALMSTALSPVAAQAPTARKSVVAHRGASAYAPEHTPASYRLAIAQGADYVEQDLAVTRDGVLICLHDDSLERTTNVEELFPDRATVDPSTGRRRWLAIDFTLAEIKRLDAGTWFDPKFAGERIPTWDETVALVGDRAGLYPELKTPALYRERQVDQTGLFVASVRRLGLDRIPGRLIVQSFDPVPLQQIATDLPTMPRVLLIGDQGGAYLTPDGLRRIAAFATGIGPSKFLLDGKPEIVREAHAQRLTVTPYTFTTQAAISKPVGRFATDLRAEMRYYLQDLAVDALFTDNPDLFPR